MEGQTGFWLLAVLLVTARISAGAQNKPSYFELGGELVLKPDPVSGSVTSIVWRFNKNLIVGEWTQGTQPLEFSPRFQGRADVILTTGELKISKMTGADIGLYTVEINNKEQDGGYDATAIKQVPEPLLKILTIQDPDSRFLSCYGDIKEAEPVTFYWNKGVWEEGKQNMTITRKDTSGIETFSCRMKNPLGEKESKPVHNPFFSPNNGLAIAGSIVGVLAVVAVGVLVWFYLKKKKSNRTEVNKTTSPPPGDRATAPLKDTIPGSPDSQ